MRTPSSNALYSLSDEFPLLPLTVLELGQRPYEAVRSLQRYLQRGLINRTIGHHLLLCEHPPTVTLGTSGSTANLLITEDQLARRGITLHRIERGGDITYHGPGQLVAYPILDLAARNKRDVHWYMRALEEVVIQTLSNFSLRTGRIAGKTGVWTQAPDNVNESQHCAGRKIASLGVRISRWCTLHGIAVNVLNCSAGFSVMHPCGLRGAEVTSLEQELGGGAPHTVTQVTAALVAKFSEVFRFEVLPASSDYVAEIMHQASACAADV